MFDYIIIGSGFAGAVIAERIANISSKKVLIIEKRNHIGGNCYDYYDENNILVHKYGPHIFHTHMKHVWDYLSNFTEWQEYEHKVLGLINGKKVPIPFNLNSLYEMMNYNTAKRLEDKLVKHFGYNIKIPILQLKNVEDKDLKFLADFVYKKVFLNYTEKQWGMKPEDLDPSVTARVPIYISRDDRYFQDEYQGMPKEGYTKLFERMINNSNIEIMLETDFKEVIELNHDKKKIFFMEKEFKGTLIYTGKIDEFFNYKFGKLPYRSLKFNFETINKEYFQETGTVNFPNDYDFTRITEFKHLTGQKSPKTSIVKEYPQEHNKTNIPYYPIPRQENLKIYKKYYAEAQKLDNVIFLGRLAQYKYYNMDIVIDSALKAFGEKITNE